MKFTAVEPIISFDEKVRQFKRAKAMTAKISKHAVVDPAAQIGPDVEIGPFCVVGPGAVIGRGTRLDCNVHIKGKVIIGEDNKISAGVVIGGEPQDIGYQDEETEVVVGDRNVIRENVTINRGTVKDTGVTRVGNDCYFMSCVHIAHDCQVGNKVIIASNSVLGGHVHAHDHSGVSGGCAIHHKVTLGSYSFVGGVCKMVQDLPPFMLGEGVPGKPRCINIVALKRNDFSRQSIKGLSEAYRLLFRSRLGYEGSREILESKNMLDGPVSQLLDFILYQNEGKNGRGREGRAAA